MWLPHISVLPGISSVSYLAAKTGESYEDAILLSLHGRKDENIIEKIRYNKKIFLLTSGINDVQKIAQDVCAAGIKEVTFTMGYRLSYEDESIKTYSAEELSGVSEDGLITCLIQNKKPGRRSVCRGIKDDRFIRGDVPMTKEEVRTVSISKLGLFEGAVVYDIGAGTGSVSVQIASASESITVYAIEKKAEALELIERNRLSFGLGNIRVIEAEAPCGLKDLPAATHAFIGGSSGKLPAILRTLREINPSMRVCINAVSLETLGLINEIMCGFDIKNEEIISLQPCRAKKVGEHHLMRAENPVFIFAFEFSDKG